ncbi:hypothetical protein K1T71_012443, partial [Dendrolimus kikuchii]
MWNLLHKPTRYQVKYLLTILIPFIAIPISYRQTEQIVTTPSSLHGSLNPELYDR